LFVGTRVNPSMYPESPTSYFLINDGKGNFVVKNLDAFRGLVCDALFMDINKDGFKELVIIGEWMSPQVISFKGNKIELTTALHFSDINSGWWNRIHAADLDLDGDLDLVAANWGLNSQYKANDTQPVELFYGDFDNNGYVDPIMCYYVGGKSYPVATRDEMTDQMVSLRQRFPTYDAYSDAGIRDILDEQQMSNAKKLSANILNTVWFENKDGKFIRHELPSEANYTSVHAIAVEDFNGDGKPDIFLGGNQEKMRIRTGKMDASYGVLLAGDAKGNFSYVNQLQSGLKVNGCIRDAVTLKNGKQQFLLVSRNDQQPVILKYLSNALQ
ncbi:MAG: FG-GAP repeat domain-containing protein, partial [Flavitalea sp.]